MRARRTCRRLTPAVDPHGGVQWVAPETIGAPWQVLAEPGRRDPGAVLARISDVDQRWDLAPATWFASPEHSVSLADLFPDSEYEISPGFGDVRAARFTDLFAGAPLYLQLSVGVPLGGGVLAALEELVRGLDPVLDDAESLGAAMRFGWRVARHYLACAADWDVVGTVTVAEVMTLAFAQLSAVLADQAHRQQVLRNWMAVVARHSLHEIWAELGPRLQASLASACYRCRWRSAPARRGRTCRALHGAGRHGRAVANRSTGDVVNRALASAASRRMTFFPSGA
jgi:hypothetical protein